MADPQWYANDVAVIAAVISVVALGVSVISAWYARQQASASKRQASAGEEAVRLQAEALQNQAQDTHQALEIARQSADAAERLAVANETLAISGQRGWLIIIEAEGSPDRTDSKVIIRTKFTFKNVGKTPIAGVRLRHCKRVLADDPKDNDFDGLETVYDPTIAPGAVHTLRPPLHECSPTDFSKIKSKREKVYFFGNANYQDVFGHPRTTYWRWEFNGDELVPSERGNRVE
jgi:hypothetical protein